MPPIDDTEQRLIALEVKACFTEDLVDHLNHLVSQQQQQIDALLREVQQLRQQGSASEAPAFRSLRDDLPPHY